MRELSNIEKEIVIELLNGRNTLSKLLGNYGKEIVIAINRSEKKAFLLSSNKDGISQDPERLLSFLHGKILFVFTLVHLLDYLEKNGYVAAYLLSNENDNLYYSGDKELIDELTNLRAKKGEYELDDVYTTELLIKYSYRIILTTEALKEFFRRGFKTAEQDRFDRNSKMSVYAIALSFFIGVGSLLISIYGITKPTTIDSQQMDAIIIRLDSLMEVNKINKSHHYPLDSIIVNIHDNDEP